MVVQAAGAASVFACVLLASSLVSSLSRPSSIQLLALAKQSRAVRTKALDEGLPTLTDDSIWDNGSPQTKASTHAREKKNVLEVNVPDEY